MHRIFLSHSSSNNREAKALKHWLTHQVPELANDIFLDLDDLQIGDDWADELQRSVNRCEAVICLISKAWMSSTECDGEFRMAEILNKQINAAIVDPKLKGRLSDLGGMVLPPGTPADFGKMIADDIAKWTKVVKSAGLKPG